jgi:hypothetical protein
MQLRVTVAERRSAVNLLAALLLLSASPAAAHPEFAPNEINRYVRVDLVAGDELRLAYTLMYGTGPALPLRQAADANHDGRVDDAEAAALGRAVLARAQRELMLDLDGARLEPSFDEPVVGLAGAAVVPSPLSVDLIAHLHFSGAPPHTLRVDIAADEDRLGEIELRLEEGPRARLLSARRSSEPETPEAPQTRFLFRGPKRSGLEDRSVTFRFSDTPAPPRPPVRWPRAVAALLAGVLLLGIGWLARRARRRYRNMKG